MRTSLFLLMIVAALAGGARAAAQTFEYADIVATYRRGAFDEAIEKLLKAQCATIVLTMLRLRE